MADAAAYIFLGPEPELAYLAYRDLGTGEALTGRPGQSCRIAALDPVFPVPPDSRWVPASSPEGKAAKAAADAQAAAEAKAAQEAAAEDAAKPTKKADTGTSAKGGE